MRSKNLPLHLANNSKEEENVWTWAFDISWNNWSIELSIWFDTPTTGWIGAQLGPARVMLFRADH